MGLNFVIGCHRCRERVWMFRGDEARPLHSFYRAHWDHSRFVELTDDQSDNAWADEYLDVGHRHGVAA